MHLRDRKRIGRIQVWQADVAEYKQCNDRPGAHKRRSGQHRRAGVQPVKYLIAPTFLIAASLAGCGRAPQLEPRLILQAEPVGSDFWLSAPYVLVVKIVSYEIQGSRRPVYRGGEPTLQLVRFVADVENVIKGDLADKRVAFFFFAKTDQGSTYFLDTGKRYIVSLRREGGILRSFARCHAIENLGTQRFAQATRPPACARHRDNDCLHNANSGHGLLSFGV